MTTMSCEEFLARMSDYLDGDHAPELTAALQAHAYICAPCQVVLDSTGQMLRIVGDERTFALPEGAQQRLRAALEEGLGESLVPDLPGSGGRGPGLETKRGLGLWGWFMGSGRRLAWVSVVLLAVLAGGVMQWRASASTMSGWLMDRHCLSAFAGHDGDHPRDCLLKCASKGYGLVDDKGTFHPFDAKGNRRALAAVKASHRPDHMWVTVKARPAGGDGLDVEQLALSQGPD